MTWFPHHLPLTFNVSGNPAARRLVAMATHRKRGRRPGPCYHVLSCPQSLSTLSVPSTVDWPTAPHSADEDAKAQHLAFAPSSTSSVSQGGIKHSSA